LMYYNRKVALTTLGCKLNFSETSQIGRSLTDNGYVRVDFSEHADFYIINTCSVTENADKQTKSVVRTALRTNPEAKVVVIGCYAQLKPEEIAQISGVNMVLGAKEKFNLHEHLDKLSEQEETIVLNSPIEDINTFKSAFSFGERTRAFLKVQDGCDYKCSFCTIPLARGASRSTSISEVLKTAKEVAKTGVKEVVLTGVNIGDFGKTSDGNERTEETLFHLIQELEKIEGIERWRISSIEPNLLTEEIIRFVSKSKKFMPHFHIPLQSGSDRILKFMRRKYLTKLYRERIELIKQIMPHACIGVDVIVGFPGETEEEFLKTYEFINSLDVSYLHVFTYSERANTRALDIEPVIPQAERKKRNEMLRILSAKKRNAFYQEHIESTQNVLWEAENDMGLMYGFTENYIKVARPFSAEKTNSTELVLLEKVEGDVVRVASTSLSHRSLSVAETSN
ncbi:MAG TPA: tRNA (N(6)-L-threonylcarbamoyladenosine(37)-C(2))-methylthiotransferase MtaB, partial [Chitinophagales bacterium]